MITNKFKIILGLVLAFNLLIMFPAVAQDSNLGDLMGGGVEKVMGEAGIQAPSVGTTLAMGIRLVLSLLATIFLVLVIIAGYKWMTAGGNEEVVRESQRSIKQAIIGLLVVLAAYGLTYFIFQNLPIDMGDQMPTSTTAP